MALEAVHRNRRVVVAGPAEMLGVLVAHRLPVRAFDGVAANAFLEAELAAPDAFMHGFVTLMLEHEHVETPHVAGIGNTMLAASLGGMRHQIAFRPRGTSRQRKEEERRSKNQTEGISPHPVLLPVGEGTLE